MKTLYFAAVFSMFWFTTLTILPIANMKVSASERRLVAIMDISSSSFKNGQSIPSVHTADGSDISPALRWLGAPAQTKSFVLICDDPDAPMGTWVHWLIYDIPSAEHELPADVPGQPTLANGSKQGINSFGKTGYGGPAPPPGKAHRYFFKLYALDTVLGVPSGLSAKDLEKAVSNHVLAQGQLIGKYGR